jgi:cytochrome c biogenesis protein CcmG/thiol:disulfide interchange protein DsbE
MSQNSNSKMILTIAVVTILVFALGYAFLSDAGSAAPQAQNKEQSQTQSAEPQYPSAPDFVLKDLQDQDVRLSSYKGQVVFVNFWATWCGPCRQEIPHFVDLVNKYGKDGFTVLGIALDPREFEKVAPFAEQMGINYPVLYDKSGVSQLYGGIRSIPTTFVVNRDGKVVDQIVGSRPHEVFEQIVTSNL